MKRHVQVFKRLFDAAASAAGLLLLAPVLLAIGLLVFNRAQRTFVDVA